MTFARVVALRFARNVFGVHLCFAQVALAKSRAVVLQQEMASQSRCLSEVAKFASLKYEGYPVFHAQKLFKKEPKQKKEEDSADEGLVDAEAVEGEESDAGDEETDQDDRGRTGRGRGRCGAVRGSV